VPDVVGLARCVQPKPRGEGTTVGRDGDGGRDFAVVELIESGDVVELLTRGSELDRSLGR
jgi:hypothetical protein